MIFSSMLLQDLDLNHGSLELKFAATLSFTFVKKTFFRTTQYVHVSQIGDDVIAVEAAASKGIYLWDYLTNEFKFFRSLSNAKSIPTSAHVKISTEWLNIGKHSRPFLLIR